LKALGKMIAWNFQFAWGIESTIPAKPRDKTNVKPMKNKFESLTLYSRLLFFIISIMKIINNVKVTATD
jgi:hypothetical protein